MSRITALARRTVLTSLLLIAGSLFLLPGCGGGGGGGGGAPPSGPSTIQMGGARQGNALNLTTAVTTLAGMAPTGSTDGTGTAARFFNPYGITTDGTNLYVADTQNHTIRRVVIATGVVTTLAGTAGAAGSADDTGTAARFTEPFGITTDGTNLYTTDGNHTVRRIVIATGVVTTLAGTASLRGSTDGTGAAARFTNPFGITTDGTNLYVMDTFNHTVRRIVIATGVVTTLAGTAGVSGFADGTGSAARFFNPFGITTDGTSLYVADTQNHTIRRIVIATGVVTTLAGTAPTTGSADGTGTAARFNYPHGIIINGANLFVADTYNHTIRRIVIATGVVTTLAGTAGAYGSTDGTGSAAQFSAPFGITSDGANLYTADTYSNSTVRRIVIATGVVTTLAGTASTGSTDGTGTAARFFLPYGTTTDGTNLYVADAQNHTIRRIVIATGVVTTLAGTAGVIGSTDGTGSAAQFNNPEGITTDNTNLYVADRQNDTIRRIVIATGVVTTLAGTVGGGFADGTGPAAQFNSPNGITTDGTNLYVADYGNHAIRRVVIATGVVTTLAGAPTTGSTDGTGTAARFRYPSGITIDGTNLYVADTQNHTIRRVVIATGVVTTLAGTTSTGSTDGTGTAARFFFPRGITTDGQRLFIVDSDNNTLRAMQ